MKETTGIVGTGIYIPEKRMTAADISSATGGVWTEQAIIEKLGIRQKPMPAVEDGTQEMGARAALDCLKNTGINPLDIDLILCIGEEWKEYPLTTSGIYIQEKIGAANAWAIDLQQRCCTTVAAMEIAKNMMIADSNIKTVMIAGGYRNCDFIDYRDSGVSFMFNLAAGGGAMIMQRGYPANILLGTHIITDGSMARDAGVEYGGTCKPIDAENLNVAYKSLRLFNEKHMKDRLNAVSMPNWFRCIDRAFEKAKISRSELGFLACLHFKRSSYKYMLNELGLTEEQSIYPEDYGHIGQIDQILLLHLAQQQRKLQEGTVVAMIAAGIGYAWGANVIRWGKTISN
ncbi:MAG: 3-oxoacyl-ACP synthase [Prevotellaceae bacterium]|jgi:3-oxoacyl-[acyl-carrier-protein] synthase-3|nr:3-oxoacyl-ACP synthase [Prevotellaceae bacterium]